MRFGFGAPGDPGTPPWCEHASCREEQERELAYMGAVLNRQDLRDLAGQAHSSTVRCRHQPRRGAVRAPFPPRKA